MINRRYQQTANIVSIFRAGFVRRWHTNPELAHTNDRVDGHSARVARIILALHPEPTLELVREALTHDDGEAGVGDMPATIKDLNRSLAADLSDMEYGSAKRMWGNRIFRADLTLEDNRWLKFADRLDAYMWVLHHAPHVLSGDGWPGAWQWLCAEGEALGAESGLDAVSDMRGARHAAS